MRSGAIISSQKEKAGSTGPSFCCLTVSGRAPLQGAGNLIRLTKGLGAATPSRFGKPVGSPVHNPSAFEIHGYDLGHVVVLKPLSGLEASL